MKPQEISREGIITQENQVVSPLFYKERIEMQPGQEIIIDDCSGGLLELSGKLAQVREMYPNVEAMKLEELNAELEQLLLQYQVDMDPNNTLYILPGGGGQRLALSLAENGLYMPNQLRITVERPTLDGGTKGPARVSEESMALLTPELLEGKDIIILDDAINVGGTLISIKDALTTASGGILKNKLIAAAPIRFAVPGKNNGSVEYGVPGFDAVIASKVIYGPDPDESSPVTFLSSFIKNGKLPKDDKRLDRIAAKAGMEKAELVKAFTEMQNLYRARVLQENGYNPENPSIRNLAELMAGITDVDAMLNFMRALYTLPEIEDMTRRYEIANMLHEGYTVQQVADILQVSYKTVVRVKFWYDEHPKGYQSAFSNQQVDAEYQDFAI